MTDNLFASNKTDAVESTEDQPQDSYLERLVGEGKKFKDPESLARGKAESDAHIARLEKELADQRAELRSRIALEEALEKLTKQSSNATSTTSNATPQEIVNASTNESASLTEDRVKNLVSELIAVETTKATRQQNLAETQRQLEEVWGKGYVSHLKAKAQELGVGEEFLNDLAAQKPKAFLTLVGADKKSQGNSNAGLPPQGSTRFNSSDSSVAGIRTQSYWSQLRKTNPKEYFSDKATIQRHRDAQKLGDAFFK